MLTRNKIYVSTNNSKNITSSVKSHITIIDVKKIKITPLVICVIGGQVNLKIMFFI